MRKAEHRLEQRAQLLTTRLQERVTAFTNALTPPGQRPPFTQALTKSEALQWWSKHRLDDLGKQALARYAPEQVVALDAALARHAMDQAEQGLPIATLSGTDPSVA